MAKKLLFAVLTALFMLPSCSPDKFEATAPAYLSIEAINVDTDYDTEGSAHSKITTVWVYINEQIQGVYELPCVVPILAEGNTRVRVLPGISMNGVGGTRAIYLYEGIDSEINFIPLDTSFVKSGEPVLEVGYSEFANITQVENFDLSGFNLSSTIRSDTTLYKTADSSEIFINPTTNEDNGKAGVVALTRDRDFFEVTSVESYDLPKTGQSVYLELTYKTDINFFVGVVANNPSGIRLIETVVLFPTEDYNKVYINVVNELVDNPSANGFGIFVGGRLLPNDPDTAHVYLDNLKIVY